MCWHSWSNWGDVFQIRDYFAQRRMCRKCMAIEMREVLIQMGKT